MSTSLPRGGPRRRTRFSLVLPIALIVLALTIVGVVAAVAYLGDSEVIARATRREGYVSVPIARVTIPAYTKITRDHLFDAVNNRFVTVDVPEDTVLRGGVKARVEDVIGRVVARDKPAGYVFQEQDLLPVGTRPGLVGGIPPGKRALRIDAGHVSGCYGLQRGDGLDLVATYEIDEKALQRAARGSSAPGSVLIDPRWSASPRASVRVVAHGSVLVEPITTRAVPATSSTLTQGTVTRTRPVQELVIAVSPEEVAPVTEALALDAALTCVPRSGQPGEDASRTPGRDPLGAIGGYPGAGGARPVERIDGTERRLELVPGAPEPAR